MVPREATYLPWYLGRHIYHPMCTRLYTTCVYPVIYHPVYTTLVYHPGYTHVHTPVSQCTQCPVQHAVVYSEEVLGSNLRIIREKGLCAETRPSFLLCLIWDDAQSCSALPVLKLSKIG